jgi:hypothetical protein
MPHGALPSPAHSGPDDGPSTRAHAANRAGNVKIHVADYARTTLKPRHRPMVRALAEALFDDGVTPVPAARLDGFADEIDRFISPASKTLRFGLLVVLDLLRWLPLVVIGRFSTFENVALADRIEMLRRLERSKVALFTLMLVAYKTIMTMIFFEEERELLATGYPGPQRARWKRSLAVAPATAMSRSPENSAAIAIAEAEAVDASDAASLSSSSSRARTGTA